MNLGRRDRQVIVGLERMSANEKPDGECMSVFHTVNVMGPHISSLAIVKTNRSNDDITTYHVESAL